MNRTALIATLAAAMWSAPAMALPTWFDGIVVDNVTRPLNRGASEFWIHPVDPQQKPRAVCPGLATGTPTYALNGWMIEDDQALAVVLTAVALGRPVSLYIDPDTCELTQVRISG